MATMREMVTTRVNRLESFHQRSKRARFGWLIAPTTQVIGWLVLIVGIITIPLPGQGWLTTFLGVGILSLEANWARRLLSFGVRSYDTFFDWYHRQSRAVRWSLIAAMLVVIWLVFMALIWLFWAFGALDFLNTFMTGLGLSRF